MLYVAGMAGQLFMGRNVVLAVGVGSGLVCLYFLIRENVPFFDRVLTPGFAAFVLITLFFWWNSEGRVFMQWDDFSHWGLGVRNMHFFGKLGNVAEATTKFKDYPPPPLDGLFFTSFKASTRQMPSGAGRHELWLHAAVAAKGGVEAEAVRMGRRFSDGDCVSSAHGAAQNTYVGLYVDAFPGRALFLRGVRHRHPRGGMVPGAERGGWLYDAGR